MTRRTRLEYIDFVTRIVAQDTIAMQNVPIRHGAMLQH
jgi:hypothetical protein